MLLIDAAKAPPPSPESMAAMARVRKRGSGRLSSHDASEHGTMSIIEVSIIVIRPPIGSIANELMMRKAPPAKPASEGSVYLRHMRRVARYTMAFMNYGYKEYKGKQKTCYLI